MSEDGGSEVTKFVLKNIVSYQHLNAATLQQGEAHFADELVKHLPELSKLKPFNPKRIGATAETFLYHADHSFLVKKLKFNIAEKSEEEHFEETVEQQKRAEKYLGNFIPNTVLIKRKSSETGKTEYLSVQDVVDGEQFKAEIWDAHGHLPRNIEHAVDLPQAIKGQLEEIISSGWKMFKETGYSVDVDFMIDYKQQRVWVFDTDLQTRYPSIVRDAKYLHKLYKIKLPDELAEIISD